MCSVMAEIVSSPTGYRVSDSQQKCVLDGNASVVHLSPVI